MFFIQIGDKMGKALWELDVWEKSSGVESAAESSCEAWVGLSVVVGSDVEWRSSLDVGHILQIFGDEEMQLLEFGHALYEFGCFIDVARLCFEGLQHWFGHLGSQLVVFQGPTKFFGDVYGC